MFVVYVRKKSQMNDEDQEGLKELIWSSDCVRGQGETRVTLMSLTPPHASSLYLFKPLSGSLVFDLSHPVNHLFLLLHG